jgi:hypothetical protein
MYAKIAAAIKQMVTEDDENKVYSLLHVGIGCGFIVFFLLAIGDVFYLRHAFDAQSYGIGLGGLAGGGGAGLLMKTRGGA